MQLYGGIDLGGTKTQISVLDSRGGCVYNQRQNTPKTYQEILLMIESLVHKAETTLGSSCTIGIGIPGSPSPKTGLIRNANTQCLNGMAFQNDLERTLQRPIRLANDANCLAVSEATDGHGKGYDVVFAVILGTGCGGGISFNAQPWVGKMGIAGEWGHNQLGWLQDNERERPRCWCGQPHCHELFLSGPGLSQSYFLDHGMNKTAIEIFQAYDHDEKSKRTISNYIDQLARGLAQTINILDPNIIILGGGLSNQALLYEALPQKIKKYIFSDVVDVKIMPAKFGDASGVRGAAWLWADAQATT